MGHRANECSKKGERVREIAAVAEAVDKEPDVGKVHRMFQALNQKQKDQMVEEALAESSSSF